MLPKRKVSIAIDEDLAQRVEKHWRRTVAEAASTGQDIPKLSNIYESLIEYGIEHLEPKTTKKS